MANYGNAWMTTLDVCEVTDRGAIEWSARRGETKVMRWLAAAFPRLARAVAKKLESMGDKV
jgi:hypothetical protein